MGTNRNTGMDYYKFQTAKGGDQLCVGTKSVDPYFSGTQGKIVLKRCGSTGSGDYFVANAHGSVSVLTLYDQNFCGHYPYRLPYSWEEEYYCLYVTNQEGGAQVGTPLVLRTPARIEYSGYYQVRNKSMQCCLHIIYIAISFLI